VGGADGGSAAGGSAADGGSVADGGVGADGGSNADGGCLPLPPSVSACQQSCSTAADCAAATATGAFTADHYRCDGLCHYLGCRSDAECTVSFGATGHTYRCAGQPCVALKFCQVGCNTPADCQVEQVVSGAFGADNYACDQGLCRYLGCFSDAECTASFGNARPYGCQSGTCQPRCASSSDCALMSGGAYSASHYRCTSGFCVWLGCGTDQDCRDTFQSNAYVCR
jgi:hypothetical protein